MTAVFYSYAEGNDASRAAALNWVKFGKEDNVYCGADTKEKIIALTFDDGPHPRYTDEVLDVLKKYSVRATFFAIGENVALYPEQLMRAASEGHEIGNHTYTHPSLKKMSAEDLKAELVKAEKAIESVTGEKPRLFRPPEGCCNKTVVECANQLKYTTVLWSVDPRDWSSPPVESMVANVMNNVRGGAILLFHDYNSSRRSPTPAALGQIIPALIDRGYSFVTVSELLHCV